MTGIRNARYRLRLAQGFLTDARQALALAEEALGLVETVVRRLTQ